MEDAAAKCITHMSDEAATLIVPIVPRINSQYIVSPNTPQGLQMHLPPASTDVFITCKARLTWFRLRQIPKIPLSSTAGTYSENYPC
jgi:hypothetical protein